MVPHRPPASPPSPAPPTLGYAERSTPMRPRSREWIVWLTWVCVIAAMIVAAHFQERFF